MSENELVCLSKDHWIDHICISSEHYRASEICAFNPQYFSPWSNKTVRVSDHHGVVATITLA
jgi:hypothetical protein